MAKLFGTDGIRGIVNQYPMTPELILKIGKAIAVTLNNGKKRPKILIGKDTRISGYMIESALTSGICSQGADVLLVGPMPTPAIAHLTKSFAADAGIVISASHNPSEHNGIKIFDNEGFKLSDKKEHEIEKLALSDNISNANGSKIGKAFRIEDAKGRYIEFAKNTVKNISLKGFKIVLDCANGAAYHIAPDIFKELGAEVIVLNNKPDGLNINLNCGALHPEIMKKSVLKEKADIGIALDGDADRVIMSDDNGNETDGDYMMAICAIEMKNNNRLNKNTVVATTMSNIGFEIAMKDKGIKVIRTDVGDRYVVEEMRLNKYSLGGEQSGHIVFFDNITTGDGTITALQILNIMKKTGKKLSELKECMAKFPQVIKNVEVKEKKPFEQMKGVMEDIDKSKKQLGNDGRIIVRYSGTENKARVMVEGKNEKEINEIADNIADEIKKGVGA